MSATRDAGKYATLSRQKEATLGRPPPYVPKPQYSQGAFADEMSSDDEEDEGAVRRRSTSYGDAMTGSREGSMKSGVLQQSGSTRSSGSAHAAAPSSTASRRHVAQPEDDEVIQFPLEAGAAAGFPTVDGAAPKRGWGTIPDSGAAAAVAAQAIHQISSESEPNRLSGRTASSSTLRKASILSTGSAGSSGGFTSSVTTIENATNNNTNDNTNDNTDGTRPARQTWNAPEDEERHKRNARRQRRRDTVARNELRAERRLARQAAVKKSTLLAKDLAAEITAQARSEAEALRDEVRAMEVAAAAVEPKPLYLAKLEVNVYDRLEQNLVGRHKIPDGVDEKNRYHNILPNPRSRVRLSEIGNDESTRYINANFVQSFSGEPRRYIATQGPLPGTINAFWRMIWERNSRIIVMVTGLREKGVNKCERYWPKALYNEELDVGDRQFGDVNVKIIAGHRKEGFITSTFKVQAGGKHGEVREVRHYWFDAWPDHGVPENTRPVVAMLKNCRGFSDSVDEPWVVHCSAGIGRTGSFIAVDHGLRQFETEGSADVITIIKKLREDRGGMVQHAEQAEFVYDTLNKYVEENSSVDPNEGKVLAETVRRAMNQQDPRKMKTHESQLETEEGDDTTVPAWRIKQLKEKELEAEMDIDIELATADDDGKGGLTGVSRAVLRKKKKLEALEAARSKATEQMLSLAAAGARVGGGDQDEGDYISSVVGKLTLGGKRYSTKAFPKSSMPVVISSDEELSEWSDRECEADAAADPQGMQGGTQSMMVNDSFSDIGYNGVAQPKEKQRRMSRRGSATSIGVIDVDEPTLMDPFYRRNALFLIPIAAFIFFGIIAGVVVGVVADKRRADGAN